MLVNMLYNIDPVKGPTGNTKIAFEKLSVQQDGKIEFWEFELFNKAFPSLFFPAFRLQVGRTLDSLRRCAGSTWNSSLTCALQPPAGFSSILDYRVANHRCRSNINHPRPSSTEQ